VPTVEGLQFSYALFPLPPGRFPFRRWRWELSGGGDIRPGAAERLAIGPITCLLVPRALDAPGPGQLC
jgi:hypothetical protein